MSGISRKIDMPEKNKDMLERGCTRVPKEVQLEIKKIEYPLSNDIVEQGTTLDIAEGGICFTSPTKFEPGQMLSLDIKINGWHRHRKALKTKLNHEIEKADILTVIAEVIWAKTSDNNSGYDIGVKFINIYEDDMAALTNYFTDILPDS